MMLAGPLLCGAAFLASMGLTGVIRRLALARGVLDVPNARSSHVTPTPRGGGMAIVVTVLLTVEVMYLRGGVSPDLAAALLIGGPIVALIGFIDDLRSVSALARLAVQFVAFAWCVNRLGPLPPIDLGFASMNLGVAGSIAAVVFLVWFLNAFNFMDGIDGIAGVEAISVTTFAALLLAHADAEPSMALALLVVAASSAGFLIWNWPPARIFMGDAGSGFLGFFMGTLAWATIVRGRLSIWVWLILLGAFLVDATVTLLRRWHRGVNLAEAHRSHAYQRLSRKYRSHLKITLGVLAINLVWLDPLAYLAVVRPSLGAACAAIAWLPLIALALYAGAGAEGDGHPL
jgi:Fuc2NAc and GlcNAc transferase